MAKTAEDLHNLASPEWIPRLSCYANTCHFMEYHLHQSHLSVLLLVDPSSSSQTSSPQHRSRPLQGPADTPTLTPHMTPSNSRLWTPQSSAFTSPADSLADLAGESNQSADQYSCSSIVCRYAMACQEHIAPLTVRKSACSCAVVSVRSNPLG